MTIWPETYDGAWTLSSAVTRSGVGLHTGDRVAVTLCPSERPGFWVSWEEDPAYPPVHLSPSQVRESQLCTTLDFGDRRVAAVAVGGGKRVGEAPGRIGCARGCVDVGLAGLGLAGGDPVALVCADAFEDVVSHW